MYPSLLVGGGTNPTALVQAGNLEVGSTNGGTLPFDGKMAQVAIYNAKVTQANIRATISQGLAGTETSLISAYSFNNSINDLNANANNLTANNSAVATNADSPFAGGDSLYYTDGTTEFSKTVIISSDGLTETVEVPPGYAIPTTGGISAVSYSTQESPYGYPSGNNSSRKAYVSGSSTTTSTSYASLADAGDPVVSVYVGQSGQVLLSVAALGGHGSADSVTYTSFKVSGATTLSGSDSSSSSSRLSTATATQRIPYTTLVEGLTPGLNTFTVQHRVGAGTGTWSAREINVTPL